MPKTSLLTIAAAVALFFAVTNADAAQMKILVSGAMAHAFEDVGADFAKRTGHTLDFTVDTTGALQNKLRSGEKADLIEVTAAGMDVLEKEKLVVPGTRVEVARGLIGVAVREGAAMPDISTPEAFKQALMSARSVAYVDPKLGGQSGTYLAGLMQRLGIADEMAKKTAFGKTGADAVQKVAGGEAELGISFVSEILPVKGAKLLGALPAAIQNYTTYSAAIPVGSPNPELARALLQAMMSADGHHAIREAGLEPVVPR